MLLPLVTLQPCLSCRIVIPNARPPAFDEDIPTPMTVDSEQVLSALRSFPQGASPGGYRLCVQHLLDAICGITVPAGQQCLLELTRWMNLLLLGQAHRSLSSWLGGSLLNCAPEERQWCLPHHSCRGVPPSSQPPLLCRS